MNVLLENLGQLSNSLLPIILKVCLQHKSTEDRINVLLYYIPANSEWNIFFKHTCHTVEIQKLITGCHADFSEPQFMLKHSWRELSHLICCSETTGFSPFSSVRFDNTTIALWCTTKQAQMAQKRSLLNSIQILEQFVGSKDTSDPATWTNGLDMLCLELYRCQNIICQHGWYAFVPLRAAVFAPRCSCVCGVLHRPKMRHFTSSLPQVILQCILLLSSSLSWICPTKQSEKTSNQHLICSLIVMSLITDWVSMRRNLLLMISCASVERRQVKGGGDMLLRLKMLACIWMQPAGDSEWNASHYQLMLSVFLLTELFKCMVGIKFQHCNRAAWRRRSRGICVELPLKLIQTVLGNCRYWGRTFLEARRERANFLNADS